MVDAEDFGDEGGRHEAAARTEDGRQFAST
jgi:hypothetical protein